VRMFFIPLMGAAVSGQNYTAPAWKKVLVALAGPLPGIIVGIALGCAGWYWHKPLFSSGSMGASIGVRALWKALYDRGAEVILNGHDHNYERFAPQTPTGSASSTHGIRQFVVGTGGAPLLAFKARVTNSQFRYNKAHGVLKLTLSDGSYAWKFITVSGTVIDAGQATCHW